MPGMREEDAEDRAIWKTPVWCQSGHLTGAWNDGADDNNNSEHSPKGSKMLMHRRLLINAL